jgi:hypothetical protein
MSRRRRVEISFLFHQHDFSSTAGYVWPLLGITGPYGVPPARANDSCLVLSMTPRSAFCILRKTEYLLSDSVSARLWSVSPRRDSIQRFQPVLGGQAITQFRANAPRTYHSVGRKEPRNKITWVSNWRAGSLNVRGVQGLAPTWFGRGYHSKGLHFTCLEPQTVKPGPHIVE